MASNQTQQIDEQWQPSYTSEQTRRLIQVHGQSPSSFNEEKLNLIREHAQYHNLPFYEGDFSIGEAIKQAAGGFMEGFTTLRVADHPDNEYEAIVRNLGHLIGFVPGILSGPLKALGLVNAARRIGTFKSIPMGIAKSVTKKAKKVVNPIIKGASNSRFGAVDTASKFFLGQKTGHIVEGAFELGAASAVSSVWDGVDAMMQSFMGGALAGGVFRGIGNIIPGTTSGDKAIKAMAGSLFMGLPATSRGATTPEQIYEYLVGAYFGSKETSWIKHRAREGMKEFEKQASKDPKLEWERDVKEMEGFEKYPEPVQKEMERIAIKTFNTPDANKRTAYELMRQLGITDKIPEEEWTTKGYDVLSSVRRGLQKRTKKKAHNVLEVAASGGAKGADSFWSKTLAKFGLPVIHYMPGTETNKKGLKDYHTRFKRGQVKGVDRELSREELLESGPAIETANQTLKRKEIDKMEDWMYDLIARNHHQIKNSNAIYAVGEIESGRTGDKAHLNGTSVKGGTGWAVQMGLDKGMNKIYVFDQKQNVWFKWSNAKDRFYAIDEAPKLVRNSAVIGTRKLTKEGKQAIKDVAEKTFGDKPITKSKDKKAIPEEEIPEFHERTKVNIADIQNEINLRRKDLADIVSDIQTGTVGKTRIKELKTQKKDLEAEIKEWEAELERNKNLAKTQYIDYATGDTIQDIDIGMKASDFPLMKKGEYFSNNFLKEVWDKPDATVSKRNKMLESGKIVENIIRGYTEKGEKNVKASEAIKEIEKQLELKKGLSDNAKRTVRRWLTEQNLGRQVIFVKTTGGKLGFTNPSNPTSSTGRSLRQIEPPKLIEEVYEAQGGKITEKEPGLVVFDNVMRTRKDGMSVEVPLDKLTMHLRFNENMSEADAVRKAKVIKGRVIKELTEKHGLYPLGGHGDKGRLVFVKFHPKASENARADYIRFVRQIKKKYPNSYKLLQDDMDSMRREYRISNDMFKKMVVSNAMYDLSLNGYDLTLENITKVIGDGFIPSAVAYNKRAQIWLTNGYSGNKEYIKSMIDDMAAPKDADYYGSSGQDFKNKKGNELTQNNDYVYRGFSGQPSVDKNGNLILRSRRDDMFERSFPGKGRGVSVTGDSKQAREYSLTRFNDRIRQAEIAERQDMDLEFADEIYNTLGDFPSTVLKIHKNDFFKAVKGKEILEGADTTIEGALPEQRVVSKENIIIPKGKWESFSMDVNKVRGGDLMMIREGEFSALRTGNYKYRLIVDPETPDGKKTLKALNIELPEHVDGAIIVRDDVVRAINKDAGHPQSGQNKSFIIDNTPLTMPGEARKNMGALLGKYMMHAGGKEATDAMKKEGIHMLIMTSSAKQTGERLTGNYDVGPKNELILKGGKTYELDPASVKYSSSVTNDSHMAQKQIWVKQLFTNIHKYANKEIGDDIIKDIHKEVIQKAFDGNKEMNKELESYLETLDKSKVEGLLKNLEDIGTKELISALQTPGAERFAEGAMQRMLRVVEKDIEASFQDGSISAEQRATALNNLRDSISPIDRLLKNVAIVGEKAIEEGKPGFSGYMHKYVRDYRAAVLHNYFVKSISRPTTDNSAVARMRPYDKWMQKKFPDLMTNDNIFYLDNAYKNTKIKLPDGSTKTLGQLWASGKKEYRDIFNALVLRVPMDSISGAHKLEFKGFTGREGHGILLHGRTMRALGGADLDGDEAFVYFGGKKEDGTGFGMKKSWMDAIHKNRKEYYELDKNGKETGNILDNKKAIIETGPYKGKTYKEILTIEAEPDNPLKKSKALYYSPYSRIKASEGAVEGRNMLGTAVTQGQIFKSAYNSLMEAPNKSMSHKTRIGKSTYRITVTPKESASDRKYQRDLTRAQIAFASDPLDEAGLKNAKVFFNTMHEAHFNTTVEKWNKNKKKYEKVKGFEFDKNAYEYVIMQGKGRNVNITEVTPYHLRGDGMLQWYKNMNSAYFSRNWNENRRHTMDEVNYLASNIKNLSESQKNTLLPKIVETLEGLDWSDSLFNRMDFAATKEIYREIGKMTKDFKWLEPIMQRSSFSVPYNKHIRAVVENELNNRFTRRKIARDDSPEGLKKFLKIINHTVWGKELQNKDTRKEKLFDYNERLSMLNSMVRQAEDFMSNDLADMATLLNLQRLFKKYRYDPKKISQIHHKVEMFKARNYLNRGERDKMDYESHLEDSLSQSQKADIDLIFRKADEILGVSKKQKDMLGDKRSAAWDQAKLDEKIYEYKSKLNRPERELFDHLMIGSLNRGNIKKLYDWLEKLEASKFNPMVRDIVTKLISENAKTSQSRLAINSEVINDVAIQNHFAAMNDVYSKMWKSPNEKEIENTIKETESKIEKTKVAKDEQVMDELVQGAHKGIGYAGIKEGEVSKEDKKIITDIAVMLKRYNNKLGNSLPDLNEQVRGIMEAATGRGKDLNSLHKRDFEIIRDYLKNIENGTIMQKIWRTPNPEIQKRYWALFPETTNRELMAHDIIWLKKEGYFVNNEGKVKKGIIRRPTYFLDILQNWIHKSNDLSTGKAEEISKKIQGDFIHLDEIKDGEGLFKIAVAQRELGIKDQINKSDAPASLKKYYRQVYDILKNDTQAEYKWDQIKNKSYFTINSAGERIEATGYEIVNGSKKKSLVGIKEKITKRFESLFKLVSGDQKVFDSYKTGKFFDGDPFQPRMNWKKFVKDAETAFERGEEINMDMGIDGMRHIMRSMMYDLGHRNNKYNLWKIHKTKHFDFSTYWPHMFFDRGQAERAMKNAIDFIKKDPTLSEKERQEAIDNVAIKHKVLTGDWEFQDMQDWDKVDVFELSQAHKRIGSKKAEKKEKAKDTIKWTDMNTTFGNMQSRKGHIPGWSIDVNVMDAYVKNVTNTFYRQLNQIMGRKVIDDAYHRMNKKFGNELANRWQTYFKLYVQGAMGQPDVIPEKVYEDPKMKLKGTPYGWWADNRVLDRVNNIREKLGIREGDLPKELKDFTYHDLRHWSNMEAKYELATLLAHPKSSITNIFGGTLHTIQSAGPGALIKARSIKYLKRINPEWNSLQDVTDFVTKKGVVPEFIVHELGLGKAAKGIKGIESFIGDLSEKINSKDPIKRKEVWSLGKKHGISDTIISKAAKFMSVPELTLRRDAFMAHYIRAWERFGGAIRDPNHPFLIEMAKKGVKATQFLYEAPFRPFFARTALGKIMTRFQLYAWNSWRFRNEVNRQATIYGFKPGTEPYKRFQRTMQIDLFVLALGNMFAYSLFDNALPQPYGWFQDTSEWLFGDEKERNKAFFGTYPTAIAPLQIITPPLARFPVSGLMQWARDDYTRFTDYQIYTMFPFGRMYRDLFQADKGLIDNPSRILEKLAGMPLRDVQRFTSERKKEIEKGTRYKQPKPSVF